MKQFGTPLVWLKILHTNRCLQCLLQSFDQMGQRQGSAATQLVKWLMTTTGEKKLPAEGSD